MKQIITRCDVCGKQISNETQEISLPCKIIRDGTIHDILIEKVYLCSDCYFDTIILCKDLDKVKYETEPKYSIGKYCERPQKQYR